MDETLTGAGWIRLSGLWDQSGGQYLAGKVHQTLRLVILPNVDSRGGRDPDWVAYWAPPGAELPPGALEVQDPPDGSPIGPRELARVERQMGLQRRPRPAEPEQQPLLGFMDHSSSKYD